MATTCSTCGNRYSGYDCPTCAFREAKETVEKASEESKQALEEMSARLEVDEEKRREHAREAQRQADKAQKARERALREHAQEMEQRQAALQEEFKKTLQEDTEEQRAIAEEAIEEHRVITANAPMLQAEAHVERARQLLKVGLHEEALEHCHLALKSNRQNLSAYELSATILLELGRVSDGEAYLLKALRILRTDDYAINPGFHDVMLDLVLRYGNTPRTTQLLSQAIRANVSLWEFPVPRFLEKLLKAGLLVEGAVCAADAITKESRLNYLKHRHIVLLAAVWMECLERLKAGTVSSLMSFDGQAPVPESAVLDTIERILLSPECWDKRSDYERIVRGSPYFSAGVKSTLEKLIGTADEQRKIACQKENRKRRIRFIFRLGVRLFYPLVLLLSGALLLYFSYRDQIAELMTRIPFLFVSQAPKESSADYPIRQGVDGKPIVSAGGPTPQNSEVAQQFEILPNHIDRLHLGWELLEKGDLAGAIEEAQKELRADPNAAGAYILLGDALSRKGDIAGATSAIGYGINLDEKFSPGGHNLWGLLLQRKGDHEGAIGHFEQAIRADPQFAVPHYHLGQSYWQLGKLEMALVELNRAVELAAPAFSAEAKAGLEQMRSKYAVEKERLKAASAETDTHYLEARRLYEQGDLSGAKPAVETVLAEAPRNSDAHHLKSLIQEAMGDQKGALESARNGLAINPNHAPLKLQIGVLLARGGEYEAAQSVLRQLVDMDPEFLDARYQLGLVLQSLGNREEAYWQFRFILRQDPQNILAQKALSLVSNE